MRKDEVIAYAIMESVADPVKPTNVEVVDKNGLFYVRFDTTLQSFECLNRNRRIYSGDAVMKGLERDHVQELIQNKTWFGEAGHPSSGSDMGRICTIDPKLISHKITSYRREGNLLKGTVETLDNGSYGNQFTKNILQGMEPAFSLRAMASLTKRQDGTSIVQSTPHIVTYDWVILPSHKEAYRDKSKPIDKVVQSIANVGNTLTESCIPITESSILDFVAQESSNVKIISDMYETALESMTIDPTGKFAILKEGKNTYHVRIEDKIQHDISRYMRNL